MTSNQTSASKAAKWPIIIVIAFVLWIAGKCSSHDDAKSTSSSTTSPTATVSASLPTSSPVAAYSPAAETPTPTPTTPAGPVLPAGVNIRNESGTVTANFKIQDAMFMWLTKKGAKLKTVDILKYAHATYPDAAQVVVIGTFPTKDAYGNDNLNTVVLKAVYDQSTLNRINYDGVDADTIWDLRDDGFVHPELQ